MDDLTVQERELIRVLRHARSLTLVVHKNEGWHVLTDEVAFRTKVGEGTEFASAWDNLNGSHWTGATSDGG